MNGNDMSDEQRLDHNRERMRRIDRIFRYSFYICAAVAILRLIISIPLLISELMTLGLSTADLFDTLSGIVSSLLLLGVYLWSYTKDKRGTIAAVIVIFLHILPNVTNAVSVMFSIVRIGLQIFCLKQYKELEYLKTQPGYPDFPGFVLNNGGKRILTDEQFKERIKVDHADMDALETGGNELPQNEQKHTANTYMDELSADGTAQNKNFK